MGAATRVDALADSRRACPAAGSQRDFEIVTAARTLELEAPDAATCGKWLQAVGTLMNIQHRRAEEVRALAVGSRVA